MEKEIREQPNMINDIALRAKSETKRAVSLLSKYEDVIFVGCGSASHASWWATHLFSEVASKKVNWAVASEFGHLLPFVNKKTLVIGISQSGETMDLLEVIKQVQEKGVTVMALINVLGSTFYRIADERVLIGAGPEKSVASTKALIGMLSHIIRLAYTLKGQYKQGQELLVQASKASQKILVPQSWKSLRSLAKKLIKAEHIFVIGRGISGVTASEVALKVKEISYIHAENLLGGELKHGTMSLIEKGVPCIVIAPEDSTYASIISNAMEIKARGSFIVGIGTKPNPVFDVFIKVPYLKEATAIPIVVVAQILAYHMTILRKLDPDMPRNLAKSVTVK
jgi:glucosamine--fructose-6-phosphate aminotransferase (isomerizing)